VFLRGKASFAVAVVLAAPSFCLLALFPFAYPYPSFVASLLLSDIPVFILLLLLEIAFHSVPAFFSFAHCRPVSLCGRFAAIAAPF
jgi:hypothetical protein